MNYDVFNGDADGIIALLQLRLNEPQDSILITGVKRDIALLQQVAIDKATKVTALDISMEKNIDALKKLLTAKIDVLYIDELGTVSVQLRSDLDMIICWIQASNQFIGGILVLATMDGFQLHPVRASILLCLLTC